MVIFILIDINGLKENLLIEATFVLHDITPFIEGGDTNFISVFFKCNNAKPFFPRQKKEHMYVKSKTTSHFWRKNSMFHL